MQYESFGELRRQADLDTDLKKRVGQIKKSAAMYEKVKSLFDNAMKNKNDPETAYIFFSRCNNVCYMMMNCEDFKEFTRGPDAHHFRRVFEGSMDEFERLEADLKSMYEKRNLQHRVVEIPIVRQPEIPEIDREDFGNFIRPVQLVEYVEKHRKMVLIIDYRQNAVPSILYPNSNFIRVLPFKPELIDHGLIFNHIRMYIDLRYRPIINDIQNYDLIVLMGDELGDQNVAPFRKGAKTKILLDAITTYNFNHQLKRNPLLLEGGFAAWENTYPMYVERPNDASTTWDSSNIFDEFTTLVQIVKNNLDGELKYPELPFQTPESFSAIKLPNLTNLSINRIPPESFGYPERKSSELGYPGKQVIPRLPSQLPRSSSPPRASSASVDNSKKVIESANNVPVIDRSNKPTISMPYSNTNSTEFPVSIDSEPVPFNKRDCRSELPEPTFDRRRPQVPALGGARIDTPSDEPEPIIVANNRAVGPPIPDRNNRTLDAAKQKQLDNICHIYERSLYFIDLSAARDQVPPGYCGLVNLGNTCFMNSALQALFNTAGLRQIFAQKKFTAHINPNNKAKSRGMISACFSALMDSVWSSQYRYIRPENFLAVFAKEVNAQLANRHQHDSQEFLSLLVDALHEETNRVNVKKPFEQNYNDKNFAAYAEDYSKNINLFTSSVINDIFALRSITQLTCMTCNTTSATFCDNPLTFLELPVNNGPYCSLRECLKHSFGEDTLDGAHKWNCPACKNPQRTLRSSKIWNLPPVLVICLKRFAMENGDFVKNNINVDFNITDLDMTPYVHKNAAAMMTTQPRYQLYAMTNHEGTLTSGHYTSIIHNSKNRWLKFDDERVCEISQDIIQSPKAYILFYRKVAI